MSGGVYVAAPAILSRWPLRAWKENSPVNVVADANVAWNSSMSGVIRAPGVSMAVVMPWMVIVAASLPKMPPLLPSRALFVLERDLVGVEGCLPRGPRFVNAGDNVPVREMFWEAPRGEERAGGDHGNPHVVDGELLPD